MKHDRPKNFKTDDDNVLKKDAQGTWKKREYVNRKNINNYVNVVDAGLEEKTSQRRGGPRRQNISLVPSDGAGFTGVCEGGDEPSRIFINISRVAPAHRRSIPSDEPSRSTRRTGWRNGESHTRPPRGTERNEGKREEAKGRGKVYGGVCHSSVHA